MTRDGLPFVLDDGGREAAGFKGKCGDCVVRAVAVATGLPYEMVYTDLHARQRDLVRDRRKFRGMRHTSPRDGVVREVWQPYLEGLGWRFVPTMRIGTGCRVHLRPGEIPARGPLVALVSRHLVAIVDGVAHDLGDPSRGGTRCVYGLLLPPGGRP